jgi:site-specific DNA-methyltransferase (adenine-specific)
VRYRDRLNRTIANDDRPERILGAFDDVYRVLKPHRFCVSFYGWNRVDAFLAAWRRAGFVPVGHIVWQKNYASSREFLEARHEQAYLLAKGGPAKPAQPLSDVRPWQYSGRGSDFRVNASIAKWIRYALPPTSATARTSLWPSLCGSHWYSL